MNKKLFGAIGCFLFSSAVLIFPLVILIRFLRILANPYLISGLFGAGLTLTAVGFFDLDLEIYKAVPVIILSLSIISGVLLLYSYSIDYLFELAFVLVSLIMLLYGGAFILKRKKLTNVRLASISGSMLITSGILVLILAGLYVNASITEDLQGELIYFIYFIDKLIEI